MHEPVEVGRLKRDAKSVNANPGWSVLLSWASPSSSSLHLGEFRGLATLGMFQMRGAASLRTRSFQIRGIHPNFIVSMPPASHIKCRTVVEDYLRLVAVPLLVSFVDVSASSLSLPPCCCLWRAVLVHRSRS